MGYQTTKHYIDLSGHSRIYRIMTHGTAIKFDTVRKNALKVPTYSGGFKSASLEECFSGSDILEDKYCNDYVKKNAEKHPEEIEIVRNKLRMLDLPEGVCVSVYVVHLKK